MMNLLESTTTRNVLSLTVAGLLLGAGACGSKDEDNSADTTVDAGMGDGGYTADGGNTGDAGNGTGDGGAGDSGTAGQLTGSMVTMNGTNPPTVAVAWEWSDPGSCGGTAVDAVIITVTATDSPMGTLTATGSINNCVKQTGGGNALDTIGAVWYECAVGAANYNGTVTVTDGDGDSTTLAFPLPADIGACDPSSTAGAATTSAIGCCNGALP